MFYYLYTVESHVKTLSSYLPEFTAPVIAKWLLKTNCELKITKSRSSKFGDYRHPFQGKGHRISINNNLNPYAFLVTLVHEFAHLKTWNDHQNTVRPHGSAWKKNFSLLMEPFFDLNVFPNDVKEALQAYLINPAASSCSDHKLFMVLKKYDVKKSTDTIYVSEIPDGKHFIFRGKRIFQRLNKERKRIRCVEVSTQRIYLFSPLAEITSYSAETSATEGE